MEDKFRKLSEMYISGTKASDGQLFCGCREEDCDNYNSEQCLKCLADEVELYLTNGSRINKDNTEQDINNKPCEEIAKTEEGKKWLYGNRCLKCEHRITRRCCLL